MFATFDRTQLPTINIVFNDEKITNQTFFQFLEEWDNSDKRMQDYNYYFDLTKSGPIELSQAKFILPLVSFLKKKRKESDKFLQYSIINVGNPKNIKFFRLIFNLTKPIAPVYIIDNTKNQEYINELNMLINQHSEIPKEVIVFKP